MADENDPDFDSDALHPVTFRRRRAPREDARLVPARPPARVTPPPTPPHPHLDTHTPGPVAFHQHSLSSSSQAVERGRSTQATDRKKLTVPPSSSARQARAPSYTPYAVL